MILKHISFRALLFSFLVGIFGIGSSAQEIPVGYQDVLKSLDRKGVTSSPAF
jgi:hypothetical protein